MEFSARGAFLKLLNIAILEALQGPAQSQP